ncbi:MAG: hypothetical protein J2P55_00200 [Rhizobiales bacterium]|nr:hypothetical protein [Hyphomicrobiales bacterium]
MSALLSPTERSLLAWLGRKDFSDYNECFGRTLDVLIEKGLARRYPNPDSRKDKKLDMVALTPAGRRVRAELTE